MRKLLGWTLFVSLCFLAVGTFSISVAWCVLDYRAKHVVGLAAPSMATGQVEPLQVCYRFGSCWIVYVTPNYANTSRVLETLGWWMFVSLMLFIFILVVFAYWWRTRNAAMSLNKPTPPNRSKSAT